MLEARQAAARCESEPNGYHQACFSQHQFLAAKLPFFSSSGTKAMPRLLAVSLEYQYLHLEQKAHALSLSNRAKRRDAQCTFA